ncbi:MAG: acetylxylan esterase [Planctomycetia bacterium]|nr:acetylxylan esterase [Planctomycetia bacterium]
MKKFLLGCFFFLICCSALWAKTLTFIGKTDKDALSYKPGEEMVFTISYFEDGKQIDGSPLSWTRTGDDGKTETGTAVSSATEPLIIKTSIDVPGFVRIQVFALDENGNPYEGEHNQFNGGAGVLVDQIKGYPEPADFDEFWAKQKKRLAEVPLRADLVEVDSGNPDVVAYDIKVDCAGPKPVSGYLCKPKNAEPKSLPALISFHGYGVYSANKCVDDGKDKLRLDINAHGIENGQPSTYYQELAATSLKNYGFDEKENSNPETCYWNGMTLRIMRALEFVKSQPEWDGKTLIVTGGSQGGFQCLTAAGLDSDVSDCIAHIPWLCDLSGKEKNQRVGSFFFPNWVDGLGYYDTTNHAKRIKAKTTIIVGLGDYVCPPSGEMVLFNNMTAPTRLEFSQGRTHGYPMPEAAKSVLTK